MQSTTKQRIQYAIWRVFPGGWLALGLGAIAGALTPLVTEGPPWVMAGLAVLCVAPPFAYGLVEFAMGGRKRQVGPLEFTAEAPSTGWYDVDDGSGAPDVDGSREGIQKHGIHYADQRRIKVHAAEAKGPVCHHELDLLAAHVIWPDQSEPEDIESLKELGVR